MTMREKVMGIFGALTNAVTGLRAQSYALENISGNIANSQTTAFKRVDTSFQDLIPDAPANRGYSGSVIANSRNTNTVQGDIQNSTVGTFMAINGSGFFVVQKPSNYSDNRPIFDGVNNYTRRGDFQTDKDGYLINGAGYYLMGIPIDSATGNPTGSVPQMLQFQNDFLPAVPTTQIEYRANLASYPLTSAHDTNVPGSELMDPASFSANPMTGAPVGARLIGTGATLTPDAPATVSGSQDISALTSAGGSLVINSTTVTIPVGADMAAIAAAINAQAGATGVSATTTGNRLNLSSADADSDIQIGTASSPALLTEIGLGVGTTNPTNLLTQSAVNNGQTLTVQVGSNAIQTITFGTGAGQVSTLDELNTALGALSGVTATVDQNTGDISIVAQSATEAVTVGGTASALAFGLHTKSGLPANQTVIANDVPAFLQQTIDGGAITAYNQSGAPVNVQLRWGKVDSATTGGTDTWNLFYQESSSATGNAVAWRNVGVSYSFVNGKMDPVIANVTLSNVTVDGVSLGDINIAHGANGLTQFADANGNAQVNLINQNGYAAGNLQSVSVSDKGRVVGNYSNGRTIDLAEITLANFNGPDKLKRVDGGAFEVTDESGPPLYGAAGKIVGSALEGSNTDIADEFTKLIVTQQAYSANTRIVTTANEMAQDLLNVLR
jgi:flagellar hook protein FlgE